MAGGRVQAWRNREGNMRRGANVRCKQLTGEKDGGCNNHR